TKDGKRFARWKSKGKKRSAPVTGKNRIVVEDKTCTARFRDADGCVRKVATGCRLEMAARSVLAVLERRSEHVISGILKPTEAAAADHLHAPISNHVRDYLAHLLASGAS